LTRRLWFAVGVHMAWNFAQGGIFGIAVSGFAAKGLLQSAMSGPEFLTGGAFGAEASIIAVMVCVTGFIFLMVRANRRGRFIKPFWLRKRSDTGSD
ncbi:MAG TPA: CPBP family intramembrane glutamate endopeptidase, partial [Bacteroidota bacterium]